MSGTTPLQYVSQLYFIADKFSVREHAETYMHKAQEGVTYLDVVEDLTDFKRDLQRTARTLYKAWRVMNTPPIDEDIQRDVSLEELLTL